MSLVERVAERHLRLRLRPIVRALRGAAETRDADSQRVVRPELTPLCVTPDHVRGHLDDLERTLAAAGRMTCDEAAKGICPPLTDDEREEEGMLRSEVEARGAMLPLDRLRVALGLSKFEEEALLLCVAPEVNLAFERVIAFVVDDLNRRHPSIELLVTVGAMSVEDKLARLPLLMAAGKLRRRSLLLSVGPEPASELRRQLRAAPCLLSFLLDGRGAPSLLFRDPHDVQLPSEAPLALELDAPALARLAEILASRPAGVAAIWGRPSGVRDAVIALALATKRPLRRMPTLDPNASQWELEQVLQRELQMANELGAILWAEAESLDDPASSTFARGRLLEWIAATDISVVISGARAFRPTELLARRAYAEVELRPLSFAARQTLFSAAFPDLSPTDAANYASRLRLGAPEVRAVRSVSETAARLYRNGVTPSPTDFIDVACAQVLRQRSERVTRLVVAKRDYRDLVLAPDVDRVVREIGPFFRGWPIVSERWCFGRQATGAGLKVLFTGEPGTGKTLAAEVIAGELGLPLLRVDLAEVVSKWVGETEKNLGSAFEEALASHAVLFFDEADALFGKRAEVERGADRYANLETSYLLQKLEDHDGLVILASNLKDQIDAAFMRRFQINVHFPRPRREERSRLWTLAFPTAAPLHTSVDLTTLAELDMTGAGIASAARTAALLAVSG